MTRVSAPEHPHTHAATMRSPCQSIPMRYMYAKEKREGDYKVGKEIGLDYTVAGNFS